MYSRLLHKLTYRFHRLGFYLCSVKYGYEDSCLNQNKFKCFIKVLLDKFKIFNYKHGYYEYLEIPVTTKCSLRCKGCSNLIPCYSKQNDYDINILVKSIKSFLECINNIVYVRVLGGEPFLSRNLYRIVKELLKSNKIQRVEVVTNGTVIPRELRLIKILKDRRIIVCISEYPVVDNSRLISFLKENNINYRIDKMKFWMDYGKPFKRGKNEKELIKQFNNCSNICKSLINGQLHLCPRSSHGVDLGIIKDNSDDYLDLLDKNLTVVEKREKINKLFNKKYIKACDYCDFGTKKCKKIPVAEQLKIRKK